MFVLIIPAENNEALRLSL